MENCKPVIDAFKGKVKQFIYVASAGAYKADDVEPCAFPGDPRKSRWVKDPRKSRCTLGVGWDFSRFCRFQNSESPQG
jgi:hypothetical protein